MIVLWKSWTIETNETHKIVCTHNSMIYLFMLVNKKNNHKIELWRYLTNKKAIKISISEDEILKSKQLIGINKKFLDILPEGTHIDIKIWVKQYMTETPEMLLSLSLKNSIQSDDFVSPCMIPIWCLREKYTFNPYQVSCIPKT